MKVFVAGGTGVIGRRAVPALVEAGHDVSVLARSPERDRLVDSMGATPIRVDLFDLDRLVAAIAGHSAVVNLATHIPPMTRAASSRAWEENNRIRETGAANLVEAARRNQVARVVQESITFPYADAGDRWIGEDADRPHTDFSAPVDKAEAEATGDGDIEGVVLRFAQFYAPDASHTQLFARAFRWGLNPYVGDPDTYTSVIGMEAAGRAVVAALDVEPGIYNIADDDPPTRRELGRAVATAIGRKRARTLPVGLVRRANPAADVLMRSHRIDNGRFEAATGWRPDHAGAAGVAAAVAAVLGRS